MSLRFRECNFFSLSSIHGFSESDFNKSSITISKVSLFVGAGDNGQDKLYASNNSSSVKSSYHLGTHVARLIMFCIWSIEKLFTKFWSIYLIVRVRVASIELISLFLEFFVSIKSDRENGDV